MSEIIAPSVAARLRFFITDPTTGVGVTGLTHSTITTAGYATEVNGVRSSTTSVTLTSTAATTAALATGQVIEYGLGQYGIDVPAVGTSGLIFAVVTVTGNDVRAVRHSIDVVVSSRLSPTVAGRTLNVNTSGEGDAVLNSAYLFDDGAGRLAINANVTHYQGTLQGNGDLPAKMDAVQSSVNSVQTDVDAANNYLSTIAARIGAFAGSGVNTILGFFKALMSKTASTPSDVGGTFDSTADSTEAIRDRGDVAWTGDDLIVPGADACTMNIKIGGVNQDNVAVWISTDSLGADIVAGTLYTNGSGNVTFRLTAGSSYYLWAEKSGINAIQGQQFVAEAD